MSGLCHRGHEFARCHVPGSVDFLASISYKDFFDMSLFRVCIEQRNDRMEDPNHDIKTMDLPRITPDLLDAGMGVWLRKRIE